MPRTSTNETAQRRIGTARDLSIFVFCSPSIYAESAGRAMQILTWDDRRQPSRPRAVIQQGRCDRDQCGQFSISISNGERGMTIRFDSESEFKAFLERGGLEQN